MAGKKRQKTTDSNKGIEFKEGDLVGAKVKGHSLWPGRIETIDYTNRSRPKIAVRFFGTDDVSQQFQQIKPYQDCISEFKSISSKSNKKTFQYAFKLSQQEYESMHESKPEKGEEDLSTNLTIVTSPIPNSVYSIKEDVKVEKEENITFDVGEQVQAEEAEGEEKKTRVQKKVTKEEKVEKKAMKKESRKIEKKKKKKKKKAMKKEAGIVDIITEDASTKESATSISIPIKLQSTTSSPQSEEGPDITCPPKQSLDQNKEPVIQPKSESNPEDENKTVDVEITKLTIAKLEEKIASKLKEKEALKQEKKRQKTCEKVATKLKNFNEKLQRFSEASSKLSIAKSFKRDDIREWNEAVRKFYSLLPALTKCVNLVFVKIELLKMSNLVEFRECHKTLRKILLNLNEGEKNNQVLTKNIKKDLYECEKKIEDHDVLKQFIKSDFENLKNAMIERKENDA